MKHKLTTALLWALCVPIASATTWYVNGVSGSNNNTCTSPTTACKTIKHAISLAVSGDSIMVASATYNENLTIGLSLKVIGFGASAPIIDGRSLDTVITISNTNAHVTLSKLTIRHGLSGSAGGIYNVGTLLINNSTLTGNTSMAQCFFPPCSGVGGGILNVAGTVTITNSTLSGNSAGGRPDGFGGGIYNHFGTVTISNSTLSGNSASGSGSRGGGIYNAGALTINNGTLSGNSAGTGGGIYTQFGSTVLQNSIVANNLLGGNCSGAITSKGYNLSSDGSCDFNGTGDLIRATLVAVPMAKVIC
jgi:hypothetical protein